MCSFQFFYRVNIEADSKHFPSFLRLSSTSISPCHFSLSAELASPDFSSSYECHILSSLSDDFVKYLHALFVHFFEELQGGIFLDTLHVQFTQTVILLASQGEHQVDIRTTIHPNSQVDNKPDIQTAFQLDKSQPGNHLTIQAASRLYRMFQVQSAHIQRRRDIEISFKSYNVSAWISCCGNHS